MKFPEPYTIADMAIRQLNRRLMQLFSQTENKLNQLGFDELSVSSEFASLYTSIYSFVKKKLKELYELRYDELIEYLIWLGCNVEKERVDDEIDELDEMDFAGIWPYPNYGSSKYNTQYQSNVRYQDVEDIEERAETYINELLALPNPLTHYAFDTEILRKRDKSIEAINSVQGKGNKREEINKHKRYISAQIIFYIDFTSQGAELQALNDAGVKRVQRHEMNDDKVCEECRKADGTIYDIDKIPPLSHIHCRRWFTPVNQ